MCNYKEDSKRIDPEKFQCCGLTLPEIAEYATIIKSFRGYTEAEMKLDELMKPVIQNMYLWKRNKIESIQYKSSLERISKHIGSKSEILAMLIAYAYRELQMEREMWKQYSHYTLNEDSLTEIKKQLF